MLELLKIDDEFIAQKADFVHVERVTTKNFWMSLLFENDDLYHVEFFIKDDELHMTVEKQ